MQLWTTHDADGSSSASTPRLGCLHESFIFISSIGLVLNSDSWRSSSTRYFSVILVFCRNYQLILVLLSLLINHAFSSRHGQYRPPETCQDSGRSRKKDVELSYAGKQLNHSVFSRQKAYFIAHVGHQDDSQRPYNVSAE